MLAVLQVMTYLVHCGRLSCGFEALQPMRSSQLKKSPLQKPVLG